jgi:hypothetical protein
LLLWTKFLVFFFKLLEDGDVPFSHFRTAAIFTWSLWRSQYFRDFQWTGFKSDPY